MKDFPAGYSYHLLAEVNSTNMYAMEKLYAGLAENGDVFITDFQSAGKGQRGKTWHAAPGESILMSLILASGQLTTSQTFRISAAMAVGVKFFLEDLTKHSFSIKWPNDLYQGDRKAGGILIENVVNNGRLRWTVVGIGLNINQQSFPPELPNAISAAMLTGEMYDCRNLAKRLCAYLNEQWKGLQNGGWPQTLQLYNNALFAKNEIRKLKKGSVVIPCRIKAVDGHGHLIAGENAEWQFTHGEVEWLF
jgi:BirA family biotin operon repressor/biotin-[acetyl-CoA-carboxylase] ligase